MLSVNKLVFHFGGRTLFNEVGFQVNPGDRLGLVGPNGAGKTTLLRLINSEYTPDGGNIARSSDCTIGYLSQDFLSTNIEKPILQATLEGFGDVLRMLDRMEELEHAMAIEFTDAIADEYARLQTDFERLDGYTLQSRAAEILEGLGFATADLHRPLSSFSGGWRMRVALAGILLQKPSLMMLDEPTNHLDLPSIEWLENHLLNYQGAIILVTHDRSFMSRIVNRVAEIRSARIDVYQVGFEDYLDMREERDEILRKTYENQQDRIRETERFIERFKAKASKAKQAQSRVKALERMELVDMPDEAAPEMRLQFNVAKPSGKEVVRLKNVSKSYGDLKILVNSEATLMRGDRIGLIGANGKGKSTLLRIIKGTEPIQQGTVEHGHNVDAAFYAQHQVEALNVDNTILDELLQAGSTKNEKEIRTLLGCFLFSGSDVQKKIKTLSGGEKSRVALAKTLLYEANFLMLDEPTNHLDMVSVAVLIEALKRYEGTFVIVSHDRHFVSQTANKIWYIDNFELKEYPGTFDEYHDFLARQQLAAKQALSQGKAPDKQTKKVETKSEEPAKPLTKTVAKPQTPAVDIKKLKKEFEQTEHLVFYLEEKKSALESEMAKPEVVADTQKYAKLLSEYSGLNKDLTAATEKWTQLAEKIGG